MGKDSTDCPTADSLPLIPLHLLRTQRETKEFQFNTNTFLFFLFYFSKVISLMFYGHTHYHFCFIHISSMFSITETTEYSIKLL